MNYNNYNNILFWEQYKIYKNIHQTAYEIYNLKIKIILD